MKNYKNPYVLALEWGLVKAQNVKNRQNLQFFGGLPKPRETMQNRPPAAPASRHAWLMGAYAGLKTDMSVTARKPRHLQRFLRFPGSQPHPKPETPPADAHDARSCEGPLGWPMPPKKHPQRVFGRSLKIESMMLSGSFLGPRGAPKKCIQEPNFGGE